MTGPCPSELIPKTILGYWIVNDDYLYEYSLHDRWSPFEAACLIFNMKPGVISGGEVWIGREPDPSSEEDFDKDAQEGLDPETLIKIANIILGNNNNQAKVPAADIVHWAVTNNLLSPSSYLAKKLLPLFKLQHETSLTTSVATSTTECESKLAEALNKAETAEALHESCCADLERPKKKTGKHHADNREKMLGAAIAEIALNRSSDKFFKGGDLNASRLAEHINDQRHKYNLPETHGFSTETIKKAILAAISAARQN